MDFNPENKGAEDRLKLEEERLKSLLELSQMKYLSERELVEHSLEELVRLTRSKIGYLHFMNPDQNTIQLFSWSKDVLKTCTAEQIHHYPLEDAGVWADCVRIREPVIHNDYQNLPDKKGYPEGHSHVVRHASVPIFDGEKIVAIAGVGNKKDAYDQSDIRQLTLFVRSLWEIIERRRAEEALKRANQELEQRVRQRTAELIQINEQMVREIKERTRTEDALRESEEKYRTLVELSPDPIVLVQDGLVKLTNVKFSEVFGYTQQDMDKAPNFQEFISESHREKIRNRSEDRLKGKGLSSTYQVDIISKDGKTIPCETSAALIQYDACPAEVVFLRDISERIRAEEKLRQSEALLKEAQEIAHIGSFSRDFKTNEVMWSDELYRIFGYEPQKIEPSIKFVQDHIHPDHREKFFKTHVLKNRAYYDEEYKIIRKDGTVRTVHSTASMEYDESGVPLRQFGACQDITERQQEEENKRRLETQLQQAQKMEAIGTLAGGIAHDFNNVLGAIFGYTEMAMSQLPPDSPENAHLSAVLKAADRAKELVKQVLTISRQREEAVNPIQVTPLVKEALKLLRASLPTTIEIRQEIEFESDIVLANPTKIHQVVMNLCANAAHAMREKGGVLEIGITNVDLDASAVTQFHGLSPGPYLVLTVKDTGYGIDPVIMERIFDPYFTTKEMGEGTGLGLSVVQGIVEVLGGTITVESKPGKGSVFKVFLPRIEIAKPQKAEKREPIPTGSERILFVDDEETLALMTKQILQGLGYKVQTRTSSIEAFEAFRANPDRFDLVITDMTMPNMTGDKLAKELMKIRPDIPVVLCTGYSEQISEEKARWMGIKGFIEKPLLKKELAEITRRVLDKKYETETPS